MIRESIGALLLTVTAINSVFAAVDSETLITACKDFVAVYDRRGERRFLAGIATSTAEAMRAGLCRGVMEEHARHSRSSGRQRCSGKWYEQASFIANQYPSDFVGSSERLLDAACED